jgi:hypothetical protein
MLRRKDFLLCTLCSENAPPLPTHVTGSARPSQKGPFETGPQYSAVLGKRSIQDFQCKKKEFGCYAFLINRNYIQ